MESCYGTSQPLCFHCSRTRLGAMTPVNSLGLRHDLFGPSWSAGAEAASVRQPRPDENRLRSRRRRGVEASLRHSELLRNAEGRAIWPMRCKSSVLIATRSTEYRASGCAIAALGAGRGHGAQSAAGVDARTFGWRQGLMAHQGFWPDHREKTLDTQPLAKVLRKRARN
jgi:hypothetical protein